MDVVTVAVAVAMCCWERCNVCCYSCCVCSNMLLGKVQWMLLLWL